MTLDAKIFAIYETVKANAVKAGFTLNATEPQLILSKGDTNITFAILEELHSFLLGYNVAQDEAKKLAAEVKEAEAHTEEANDDQRDCQGVNPTVVDDHPSDHVE